MDLYEALRSSHDIQRTLCRRLHRVAEGERQGVFIDLRQELAAHAAAEERFLYCPILMYDGGLSVSRHALAEHHELDELVEELTSLRPKSTAWQTTARALSKKVHHHLKEEEQGFFQVSGKLLSATRKRQLGGAYAKDYSRMLKKLQAARVK